MSSIASFFHAIANFSIKEELIPRTQYYFRNQSKGGWTLREIAYSRVRENRCIGCVAIAIAAADWDVVVRLWYLVLFLNSYNK